MHPALAVCLGASVGALMRWGLAQWLSASGTLAANLLGGYLVGICIAVFQTMPQIDTWWRLLLITGFLGGLTTFSSFSAEVMGLLLQARYGLALLTASAHVFGALLLTYAGIRSAIFLIALGAD